MRIAQAAAKFSIPRHYIDYWRKTGMLSSPEEGDLTFQDLSKIRFILNCKERKISLRKIRSLLSRSIPEEGEESWHKSLIIHDAGVLLKKEEERLVHPDTGQLFFNYAPASAQGRLISLNDEQSLEAEISGLEERFQQSLNSGDMGMLRSLLDEILERAPDHIGALIELGNISFEEGFLEDALEFYERSLESDPECVEALYNIANIYFKQKKYAAAIRYFHRCIDLDPEFPESYYNLGIVYFSLHQPDRAEAFLRIYLDLDPDSVWADQARQFIEDIHQALLKEEGEEEGLLFDFDGDS